MRPNLENLESRVVPASVKTIGTNMFVQADWTDRNGINVFSIDNSLIVVNNISYQVPAKVTQIMVYGSEYRDSINLQNSGKVCFIRGYEGDDNIVGSVYNDNIDSGDGNDRVDGWFGSDIIVGGNGNDSLWGGAGSDSIVGGAGNDYIDGGADADVITAGMGDDTVFGRLGNDSIRGGDGNDYIEGGSGDDSLFGEKGRDRLIGGDGYDLIVGGLDRDYIDGRDGGRFDLRDNIWLEDFGDRRSSEGMNTFFADAADYVNGSKYKYW